MERLIILQALAAAALLTGRAAAAPNDVRTYSGPREYSRACILKLKNMGLAYHRPKCSIVETREFFIVAIPGENGTSRLMFARDRSGSDVTAEMYWYHEQGGWQPGGNAVLIGRCWTAVDIELCSD